jgi:hypothetical protein
VSDGYTSKLIKTGIGRRSIHKPTNIAAIEVLLGPEVMSLPKTELRAILAELTLRAANSLFEFANASAPAEDHSQLVTVVNEAVSEYLRSEPVEESRLTKKTRSFLEMKSRRDDAG